MEPCKVEVRLRVEQVRLQGGDCLGRYGYDWVLRCILKNSGGECTSLGLRRMF